jgi:hypothetical protein
MAGERTLYRKVQVLLDYAKEVKHRDRASLMKHIVDHRPTNFVYYWRDRVTDEIRSGYSTTAIDHTIHICEELKLLGGEGLTLTRRGVGAADPRRFPTIVGKSACEFLEVKGFRLEAILDAIKKIIRSSEPKPPTANEIWAQLGEPQESIDHQEFRQMVSLLGQCQILSVTQNRIFLPWPAQ